MKPGARLALAAAATAWTAGFGPSEPPARPDLLMVSVDTLRPDALGWVAGQNPTPASDTLAREGFRFPAAVSPVPLTLPAHVSLMTGRVPRRHGVRDNGQVLASGVPTLAEALAARGYVTAAFVSGFTLRAQFGLDRGFQHYDDELPAGRDVWTERRARDTTAAALAWLRGRRKASGTAPPFFLFVHYYDAHDPYEPPPDLAGAGPRGAYDGEVRSMDRALAELRRGLHEAGADRKLLTLFCADHGEGLGEHGEDTHGFFIYDSTTLVPLVFHFPGRVSPGSSALPARLVDVAPTLLELLSAGSLSGADGVSLAPTLAGRRQEIPPAYLESQQPWLGYGWAPLSAVRAGGWKLMAAPRPELFDLRNDPQEQHNLFALRPQVVSRLQTLMRRIEDGAPAVAARATDPDTLERLRALGYTGGGGSAAPPPGAGLPDPKDRLRLKRRLGDAETLLLARDPAGALRGFDAVLAEEKDNRLALLRSGKALLELRRPREAAARLQRLVALDPDHAEARYELAEALTLAGDLARAAGEWRETIRLQPRRVVAWSNLGAVLARRGQMRAAADALEPARALAPEDVTIRRNLAACRFELARAAAAAGRTEEARGLLSDALGLDPALCGEAQADPRLRPLLP